MIEVKDLKIRDCDYFWECLCTIFGVIEVNISKSGILIIFWEGLCTVFGVIEVKDFQIQDSDYFWEGLCTAHGMIEVKYFQIRDSNYFWEGLCTAHGMIEVEYFQILDSDYFLEGIWAFLPCFLQWRAHPRGRRRRTGYLFWWETPKSKIIKSSRTTEALAGPHHLFTFW